MCALNISIKEQRKNRINNNKRRYKISKISWMEKMRKSGSKYLMFQMIFKEVTK